MVRRQRYLTKFANLTLSVREEPDQYILHRLKWKWPPSKIYLDLKRIAHEKHLPMISKKTIYLWIEKVKADIKTN